MHRPTRSHAYQLFMLALCLYALGVLAAHSLLQLSEATVEILDYADVGISVLFLADFVHSLVKAPGRWRYLYTWGWLDLASSIPMLPTLRLARAARVVRVFRVLRGVRATKLIASFVTERRAEGAFLAASLVSLLLVIFSSISILQFETTSDANIRTAADALWWAISTITTVGYGDRFPVTSEGRLIGGVLMLMGVGLFGTVSGFIASWFLSPKRAAEEAGVVDLTQQIRELKEMVAELARSRSEEERGRYFRMARPRATPDLAGVREEVIPLTRRG